MVTVSVSAKYVMVVCCGDLYNFDVAYNDEGMRERINDWKNDSMFTEALVYNVKSGNYTYYGKRTGTMVREASNSGHPLALLITF